MEQPQEAKPDRSWVVYLALGGLAVTLVLFPAVVVGALVYLIARRVATRWEALAVIAVTGTYLALYFPGWLLDYFNWARSLVGLSEEGAPFPWVPISALGLLIAAIAVLALYGTRSVGVIRLVVKKSDTSEGILPTEVERTAARAAVVAVPVETLLPAPQSHSIVNPQPAGSRSFPIGLDKKGTPVFIRESEIRTHALLFGSTGAGKTSTIEVITGGLLDLGWSGLILDLKEDAATGGLLEWCETYANYHAVGFQSFRISDPEPQYWFSVLNGMGPDEARDTILASQEFEAAYYRALNEKQLGQLVTLLYAAREVNPADHELPTVYDIGKILASNDLAAAVRPIVADVVAAVPGYTKDDFDSLLGKDKAFLDTAAGLGARLTAMYETRAGRIALRPGGGRDPFDVTRPGLSYVGLDSMGKPELTRLVGASVLRRMAVYAADRTSGKVRERAPRFLVVDEANFVNRKLLLELLSRARSAGIACIVCTQGPTDWQSTSPGEPDLTSLVQNTNVAVIMSQGERTNAELCADIIGRAETMAVTRRVQDGILLEDGTLSSKIDYLVPPDSLRSLKVGEAIVRVGKPDEWQRWVTVRERDPRVGPPPG